MELKDALEVMTDSSPNFGITKMGTAANHTEIKADGTMRRIGEATAWKDMVFSLFGAKLNSSSGKVDYDYDNNVIVFSPNGTIGNTADMVGGNLEINHEFKVGAGIVFKPHIHWLQEVTSNAVLDVVFTMRYRLQRNDTIQTTAWTTITAEAGTGGDDVFDFTGGADGLYNQITKFDDITVTCGISDTFQIQIARTDITTGNISATFIDFHGEVDSDGSDTEYVKA